jgi:hypothetical protein
MGDDLRIYERRTPPQTVARQRRPAETCYRNLLGAKWLPVHPVSPAWSARRGRLRTPHAGQKAEKDTTSTNQPRKWVGPPPKEKPMTDMPDDLPSPDEFRRKMAHVDREFADARRYLSALCAEDNQALGALMAEIHRSGRAMNVLAAMAVLALDFAHLSADRLGGDVQKWLDESAMAQDTAETERDQTELGGEG